MDGRAQDPTTFVATGVFLDDAGRPLEQVTFTPTGPDGDPADGHEPVVATPDQSGRVEVALPAASHTVADIAVSAGDRNASLLAPPAVTETGDTVIDMNATLPTFAAPAITADTTDAAELLRSLHARIAALEAAATKR